MKLSTSEEEWINLNIKTRGGSRTAAASNMERFVIIVNAWKPLTNIKKRSILDVAANLDPRLKTQTAPVKKVYEPLNLNRMI